ncbi:MAG: NAD(+)/NADH kinase, partial [Candidatus Lokiarchaeota archaeon]|nr:NAD(+)/NADH kinase [Candidatus Lokiarchaeota archaeon]
MAQEEKAIAITSRMDSIESIRLAKRIMSFLIEKGERVFLEKRICNRLGRGDLGMELNQMTENKIKFVISVGGDGSILRVFHELPKKETPSVYGCAKIGTSIAFLSEGNEKTVYNDLEKILNGKYLIEKCSRLSTFLSTSPNSNIQLDEAINEVLLISAKQSKVMQISVKVNGEFLSNAYLDGLILSTPTGSTAYAFSAGGAILAPIIEVIQLVPINPYARSGLVPMVFPKDSEFEITLLRAHLNGTLIIDGRRVITKIYPKNKIRVKMSEETFKLIRLSSNISKSYFSRLREK